MQIQNEYSSIRMKIFKLLIQINVHILKFASILCQTRFRLLIKRKSGWEEDFS
jgi:hypothetical protein